MIGIVHSGAEKENPNLKESKRKRGEGNIPWLARHWKQSDRTTIVLFGGVDPVSFRVRSAQANARHDLTPSHWSDVVFLKSPTAITQATETFEVSLQPPGGFGFPPRTNGIQTGNLGTYRDRRGYPNVALLELPVASAAVKEVIERFQSLRHLVNGPEILAGWLAYVWGVSAAVNPLQQEIGVPSAVLLEYATGAVNFDLTPGLASRSSCPEAIWQAARWWYRFYETKGEEGGQQPLPTRATQPQAVAQPITGFWCVDNILVQPQQ